jgi:hypothetical protein
VAFSAVLKMHLDLEGYVGTKSLLTFSNSLSNECWLNLA